jgi:Tol biopolymer transport system component
MLGSEAEFITDRVGLYSDDMRLRAFLQNGQTKVEHIQSGEQWTIPSEGRAVSFSPDGQWLAWTAGQAGPPFDSAQRDVWVSRINGSEARKLFSVTGGGFAGWFPDGKLLVSDRSTLEGSGQVFWIVASQDDQPQKLLEIPADGRIRGLEISPNGRWLAYMHSISSDESQNGLWIVNTETGDRRRLNTFGAYQWRDGERLLVIPLNLEETTHRLQQIEASSGEITAITDPSVTPFRIANGDWHVSPNGARIAFVSAGDQNIWVLDLPIWR